MSHSLFGERFLGAREPGWHKLGKVFTDPITAVQGIADCGLGYNVEKVPMFGHIETPFGTQLVTVPGKFVIAREPVADDPEWQYFGNCSNDYKIIQNTEVGAIVDLLTEKWPVDTIGALGKGETIFVSLDAGMHEVHGEQVHNYFLITDTKNGGVAMQVAFTPVRVVCQNTLIVGLNSATSGARISHFTNMQSELELRLKMLNVMQGLQGNVLQLFDKLADAAITPDDAESIFKAAYPALKSPKKAALLGEMAVPEEGNPLLALYDEASKAQASFEYYTTRIAAFRDGARELYIKINDEYPGIGGTAWAAYNAVVESADYREGSKSVAESSIWGPRAMEKARAFSQAATFIK